MSAAQTRAPRECELVRVPRLVFLHRGVIGHLGSLSVRSRRRPRRPRALAMTGEELEHEAEAGAEAGAGAEEEVKALMTRLAQLGLF